MAAQSIKKTACVNFPLATAGRKSNVDKANGQV
jgi:hypothetical protein